MFVSVFVFVLVCGFWSCCGGVEDGASCAADVTPFETDVLPKWLAAHVPATHKNSNCTANPCGQLYCAFLEGSQAMLCCERRVPGLALFFTLLTATEGRGVGWGKYLVCLIGGRSLQRAVLFCVGIGQSFAVREHRCGAPPPVCWPAPRLHHPRTAGLGTGNSKSVPESKGRGSILSVREKLCVCVCDRGRLRETG